MGVNSDSSEHARMTPTKLPKRTQRQCEEVTGEEGLKREDAPRLTPRFLVIRKVKEHATRTKQPGLGTVYSERKMKSSAVPARG